MYKGKNTSCTLFIHCFISDILIFLIAFWIILAAFSILLVNCVELGHYYKAAAFQRQYLEAQNATIIVNCLKG